MILEISNENNCVKAINQLKISQTLYRSWKTIEAEILKTQDIFLQGNDIKIKYSVLNIFNQTNHS